MYINGPVNYIKLSGKINNSDKIIYIFMDSHKKIDEQTRCETFDSIDISHYLYREIKYAKDYLVFFMEIRQEHIFAPESVKRDIYIKEVNEMFKSVFNKTDINKIKYSNTNPKVRLHYLDIRDNFELFEILKIIDLIKKEINTMTINDIILKITYIDKLLDNLTNNIINIKNNIINNNSRQEYYLNKIINKYSDENLRKNIYSFITDNYLFIMKNIRDVIINIKFNTNEINKLINNLYEMIIDIYSLFTDAYLLRRILDKSYVKNAVIYTGSLHALNYLFFLVKYYDFKIIKIFDSVELDYNKIIDKKEKVAFYIYNLIINKNNVSIIGMMILLEMNYYLKNIKYFKII